jgi:hypothetical protein
MIYTKLYFTENSEQGREFHQAAIWGKNFWYVHLCGIDKMNLLEQLPWKCRYRRSNNQTSRH